MVGYYPPLPPTAWGAEYYDSGTTTTNTTQSFYESGSYGSSTRPYFTIPAQEPLPEAPTKAELARAAMRRYLASLSRLDVAVAAPARPLLTRRDPLRHHRQRAARRTPRLSWLQRSA